MKGPDRLNAAHYLGKICKVASAELVSEIAESLIELSKRVNWDEMTRQLISAFSEVMEVASQEIKSKIYASVYSGK